MGKKRYIRFMGMEEFQKYLEGENLVNHTDWCKYSRHSNSVGFCFFDDSVPPEARIEYLTGVVDMSIVAVFETEEQMKESYGRYRDPEKDMPDNLFDALFAPVQMMDVKEYSIKKYNRESMKLVKYGYPFMRTHQIKWREC